MEGTGTRAAQRLGPVLACLSGAAIGAAYFLRAGLVPSVLRDWVDDAFFYPVIAGNIVEGRGSTTDGIGATNGYHPLWMLLHVVVRACTEHPLLPLVVLQFLLAATGAWLLYLFLTPRCGSGIALTAAVLVTGDATYIGIVGSGMETHLAWCALFLVLLAVHRLEPGASWRALLPLQASLALAFFARLDAALLWIVVACVALQPGGRRRLVLRAFVPPAAAAGIYLTLNQVAFGTAMPISGRIKAFGLREIAGMDQGVYWRGALDRLTMIFHLESLPLLDHLSPRLPRRSLHDVLGWSVYLLLVLAGALWLLRRRRARGARGDPALAILVGYALLHASYYVVGQRDRYSLTWAKGPEYALVVAVLAVALSASRRLPLSTGLRRSVLAVSLVLALVWVHREARARAATTGYVRDFKVSVEDFFAGVRAVQAATGPDEVIVSESMGLLGHFADRRIVSLDGLANSLDYDVRYLEAGRPADYLKEHQVRVIGNAVLKGFDGQRYTAGIFEVPPSCMEIVLDADTSGPKTPRRYVVARRTCEPLP